MAVEYTSAGGVRKNYDRVAVDNGVVGIESTRGDLKQLSVYFDYTKLPSFATGSASDATNQALPANAAIVNAFLQVATTWVGGTSLEVGTVTAAAGAAVDVDGLIPAAVGVTANLLVGNIIAGRGAQIVGAPDAAGTAHNDADGVYLSSATGPVASVASLLSVVAVGTFTAGAARLVVEYLDPASAL